MGGNKTKGKRGGRRPGAGRKRKASGSSKVIRVPAVIVDNLKEICDAYERYVLECKKKNVRSQMISAIDAMLSIDNERKKDGDDPRQLSIDFFE